MLEKPRKPPEKASVRIAVAVGVLVENRDARPLVLIARRPDQTVLGGFWEFPGGKVHDGESLAQCVVREFREELGLTVEPGRPLPEIEFEYDHGLVRLHPFYCTRTAGEPANLEVAEHRWVTPGDLVKFQFPPANSGLIERVRRDLGGV